MVTLRELMRDLTRGDGRKFTNKMFGRDEWMEPIFKDCYGNWHCLFSNGEAWVEACLSKQTWIEWTLSKKRIKLYSPIYRNNSGIGYFMEDGWSSSKNDFDQIPINPIVGWQEIEVEVDE